MLPKGASYAKGQQHYVATFCTGETLLTGCPVSLFVRYWEFERKELRTSSAGSSFPGGHALPMIAASALLQCLLTGFL